MKFWNIWIFRHELCFSIVFKKFYIINFIYTALSLTLSTRESTIFFTGCINPGVSFDSSIFFNMLYYSKLKQEDTSNIFTLPQFHILSLSFFQRLRVYIKKRDHFKNYMAYLTIGISYKRAFFINHHSNSKSEKLYQS